MNLLQVRFCCHRGILYFISHDCCIVYNNINFCLSGNIESRTYSCPPTTQLKYNRVLLTTTPIP